MEFTTIIALIGGLVALVGVVVFFINKYPPKLLTKHDVDFDAGPNSVEIANKFGKTIENTTSKITGTVDGLANNAERIAGKLSDTVQPISDGAGSVLGGTGEILSAIAERIKLRQAEYNACKSQTMNLVQEIEHLKSRHIDVVQMESSLSLGLLKVSQKYTSFNREIINTEEEGIISRGKTTEYLSVRQADFHAHLGVDLKKLKFTFATDSRILVHGLRQVQLLGILNLDPVCLLSEIREHTKKGRFSGSSTEILNQDSRLGALAEKYSNQFSAEIHASKSYSHLAEQSANLALGFLRVCFDGSGYRVEEAFEELTEEELNEQMSFGDLCLTINKDLEDQINQRLDKRLALEQKSDQIEGEILSIVTGG